ncbi:MAG TPA: TetR/AcrR family transcriptional regulator [Myxococcota bacterium]|nr:TetR/AcrR family transcriptional regulator [Myxococcota bacterium]
MSLPTPEPRPQRPRGASERRTQEERSASTRERLLDATIASLVEAGYAGTSTTAVCARAGLSRGAQLHHFPTKAELVIGAVAHLAKRRASELSREVPQGGEPDERLQRALDAIWASFSGPLFAAALELWVASRSDRELREHLVRFERQVGRAMAALFGELAGAEPQRERDFAAALELTFHVMRGMALQRILRDDDTERRRLFELWKRLVSQYLSGAKEEQQR